MRGRICRRKWCSTAGVKEIVLEGECNTVVVSETVPGGECNTAGVRETILEGERNNTVGVSERDSSRR